MLIAKLKANLLLILSGLVAVLAFLLKLSGSRTKRFKTQAATYRAKAHHAKVVMEKDKEIELEHDVRTEELADEVKKKSTSSELADPNDW